MNEKKSDEIEHSSEEAHRIAEKMKESKLLDQWGERSIDLFKFTGEVFMKEYEIKSEQLVSKYGENYDDLYDKCKKQFEAYCILNRKVQKKGDQIENFAAFFNTKNHKKTFFNAWKELSAKMKFLRKMQDQADKHKKERTLRTCLKEWLGQTMKSNRTKIKNQVLHKTEIEISKIQSEYEMLIQSLEQTLEKKLIELKKQEDEHRLLHDKYQAMYARNRIDSS